MPNPKTIRVRIAVAVDCDRKWSCAGNGHGPSRQTSDDDMREWVVEDFTDGEVVAVSFIEVDVPLPVELTVEGKVTE